MPDVLTCTPAPVARSARLMAGKMANLSLPECTLSLRPHGSPKALHGVPHDGDVVGELALELATSPT